MSGVSEQRRGLLLTLLLEEVLRDTHAYAPGVDQRLPRELGYTSGTRHAVHLAREHGRDLLERLGRRASFSRAHFDPRLAASALARIIELAPQLDDTYELLADEASRQALIDVLKLRVLGPHHAPLALTPQRYREHQARAERELLVQRDTMAVPDPWFSPLSLYRPPLPSGQALTLHSHAVNIVSVFLLGQYRRAAVQVHPGDVVLDVGGCWGDTALLFAHMAGSQGKVYTFEFEPRNLEVLRANLELNPQLAQRIEVVERALWDRSGVQLPYASAGAATAVLQADAAPDAGEVETLTIDDFAADAGLRRVDFVKTDVEGAELQVLQGARKTLNRDRPRLALAAYHRDDDLVCLPREVATGERGYRLYLQSYSPLEDETVLFAATAQSSST